MTISAYSGRQGFVGGSLWNGVHTGSCTRSGTCEDAYTHSGSKLGNWQGCVIDRLIKHLAILLTESLFRSQEREREKSSIFVTRWFNLTAIARTGDGWRFRTRGRRDKGNFSGVQRSSFSMEKSIGTALNETDGIQTLRCRSLLEKRKRWIVL